MMALPRQYQTKLTAVLTADELQKLRDATAAPHASWLAGPAILSGGEHKHG